MGKCRNAYRSAVLFLALIPFLCIVAVTGALAKDFDFSKTKAFTREMETRPDFPVSTVLANDYVYSLASLGDKIDSKKNKAVESFLKSTQQIDGGFVSDKYDKESSILFTNFALETFSLINLPPAADLARVKSFILTLKNADGGFGFTAKAKESSLVNTYYAIHSLSLLKSLNQVDAAKTAAFIKGFERPGGGFAYVKGTGVPMAKITYMAVYVLKELGKLDEATKASALKFLASSPYAKGNNTAMDSLQMLEEMGYTIDALKLLGAKEKIDSKKAQKVLKDLYIKQNGGFGPIPGYGSTPDSTTAAIRILVGMGTLKAPKTYPLVK